MGLWRLLNWNRATEVSDEQFRVEPKEPGTNVEGISEINIEKEEEVRRNPFARGAPSKQTPPSIAGIYRFIEIKSRSVVYIGVTADLARRRRQWKYTGMFPERDFEFKWKKLQEGANLAQLFDHEKRSIAKHNPSQNIYVGGNGRRLKP